MLKRIGRVIWEWLATLDQLVQLFVFSFAYILYLTDKLPDRDETMSSKVGREAVKGKKWALVAEKIIDAVFAVFGEKDHCRRNIGT